MDRKTDVAKLFRRHPLLVAATVLAAVLTLFFGVRFVMGAVYWAAHREEPVQAWMTAGYVGRSWGFNPRALDREAGLPPPQGHPLTIAEIARQRGVPVEEVIADVEEAIARLKARAP